MFYMESKLKVMLQFLKIDWVGTQIVNYKSFQLSTLINDTHIYSTYLTNKQFLFHKNE